MEQNQEQQRAVVPIDGPEWEHAAADLRALPQQPTAVADDELRIPGQWLGTNASMLNAIERLNLTIDEETEKLESRAPVDFGAFSQRKNRGLLELTRAIRMTQEISDDPRVVPQLTRLRASLVRNQAALQMHIDAVREVSAIIARSIQEAESDGTYSLAGAGKSK